MGFFHECICSPALIDNVPYMRWFTNFGLCFYSWRDICGSIFGAMNILFWFILSLPQYLKMYRTKSSAGLSLAMLLLWTVADGVGLVGLWLSGESGSLFALTVFFTVNNSFASLLWIYYDKIYPRIFKPRESAADGAYTMLNDHNNDETAGLFSNQNSESSFSDDNNNSLLPRGGNSINSGSLSPNNPAFLTIIVSVSISLMLPLVDAKQLVHHVLELITDPLPQCHSDKHQSLAREIIGFSCTVVCCLLNSISRFPQLIMNKQRQTTAGLSLSFCVLQLCANVCFFISRFLPFSIMYDMHWLSTALPWIISTGISTACLACIVWQVHYYGNGASIKARKNMKYAITIWDRIFFGLKVKPAGVVLPPDDMDVAVDPLESQISADPTLENANTRTRASVQVESNFIIDGNENEDEYINANTGTLTTKQAHESTLFKSISFISPIYGTTQVKEEEMDELLNSLSSLSFVKNLSFVGPKHGGDD